MIRELIEGFYSTVEYLYALVYFVVIFVVVASILWKVLMMVTGCESPLAFVMSDSMEPKIQRGALTFSTNYDEEPLRVGEVVGFRVRGLEIPILHRIVRVQENYDGTVRFLTKGDNNSEDDRDLWYEPGQLWLDRKDVVGRCRCSVPFVGLVAKLANNYPWIRILFLVGLGCLLHTYL